MEADAVVEAAFRLGHMVYSLGAGAGFSVHPFSLLGVPAQGFAGPGLASTFALGPRLSSVS